MLKLARATDLKLDLGLRIQQYLAQDPQPRLAPERIDARTFALRLALPTPVDETWATIIGDTLHNVRSALDALTWAVVTKHVPILTDDEARGVAFPIHDSDDKFDRGRWAPKGLSIEVREQFRTHQSYYQAQQAGLDDAAVAATVAYDALTRLREWSNIDKHRGLHPTVCALSLTWVGTPGHVTCEFELGDPPPWGHGSVAFRAVMEGLAGGAPPQVGSTFDVVLAEDADLASTFDPMCVTPVTARLDDLIRKAQWIVGSLLPLL